MVHFSLVFHSCSKRRKVFSEIAGNCFMAEEMIFPFERESEVETNPSGRLVIEALQAKTAAVGQSIVLSCVLARGNTAKFTWTKNGVLLHDDNRMQIVNLRRTSTLNIDDVESMDRGVYTCTAADDDSEDRDDDSEEKGDDSRRQRHRFGEHGIYRHGEYGG